jgi:hypothetical protein
MVALNFDADCNTSLHVLKNTNQCLRGNASLIKWGIIKRRKIWPACRSKISTDQPIVKKLPLITKSVPCCVGCSAVLLKTPNSFYCNQVAAVLDKPKLCRATYKPTYLTRIFLGHTVYLMLHFVSKGNSQQPVPSLT